jgi:copper resistance protein B
MVIGLALSTASPGHAQSPGAPAQSSASAAQHTGHQREQPEPITSAPELPPFIPPLTDEVRKAAFPDVKGHAVHDNAVNYFVLFDQLEWQAHDDGTGLNVDSKGWVGRDRDRLWFRAEGGRHKGRAEEAEAHVLYGRQVSRWWDMVAGVRQDSRPGPAQTWAAIGVQGLAPYWFDVEATAYVGASGRTQARLEVEYELLLTNRLVAQPLIEIQAFGKSDPERGVGAGLSTTDAGVRFRYEIRRELAPYVGITWKRRYGKTADLAKAAGESTSSARFVTGVRVWF